jgi:hypothetical protein
LGNEVETEAEAVAVAVARGKLDEAVGVAIGPGRGGEQGVEWSGSGRRGVVHGRPLPARDLSWAGPCWACGSSLLG